MNCVVALALVALAAVPARSQIPRDSTPLIIDVLDVGQAEMAVVRTPDGQFVVVDAGLPTTDAAGLLTGVYHARRVALAIGSHRHQDHIGGMPGLIAALPVALYVGDTTRVEARPLSTTMLRRRLNQQRVPVQDPGADTLEVGEVRVILLPRMPKDMLEENNNSIVVRLEYRGFVMLLPGDAENDEQQWLQRFYAELLRADVLEAAHHGSNNGISPAWLETVAPSLVVISAGVNASYMHPGAQAVAAYEEATGGNVYCTNRHGRIRIMVATTGTFRVETQRESGRSCAYDGTAYDGEPRAP